MIWVASISRSASAVRARYGQKIEKKSLKERLLLQFSFLDQAVDDDRSMRLVAFLNGIQDPLIQAAVLGGKIAIEDEVGRFIFFDEGKHLFVLGGIRSGNQPVVDRIDRLVFHMKVNHSHITAPCSGLGDVGTVFNSVVGKPVMGVSADDQIDSVDRPGHLDILLVPQVGEHHDDVRLPANVGNQGSEHFSAFRTFT